MAGSVVNSTEYHEAILSDFHGSDAAEDRTSLMKLPGAEDPTQEDPSGDVPHKKCHNWNDGLGVWFPLFFVRACAIQR
jgi:hypothetical protein